MDGIHLTHIPELTKAFTEFTKTSNETQKKTIDIQKRQIAIQEKQTRILDETKKIYFWLLLATFLMALISTINLMQKAGANQAWLNLFYGVILFIAIAILIKILFIIDFHMPKKLKGKK